MIRANSTVPAGARFQDSNGALSAPSQVKSLGIGPPSAKSGLVNSNVIFALLSGAPEQAAAKARSAASIGPTTRARLGATVVTPDIFLRMDFQRFDHRYQLRFLSGERAIATLLAFCRAEGIGYAALSGLGAVSAVDLAYFSDETREYETHAIDEQQEVIGLTGNITLKDGQPFAHVHATFGARDLSVRGGHVMEMTVRPNLEIWLTRGIDTVTRLPDEESGLYLMSLPDRA
jgi:predicted DNA-binding protein with PD1-like motif